ncbi:MAG: hypothetical protein V3573_03730 [Desulfovibrionaceae bacterium]
MEPTVDTKCDANNGVDQEENEERALSVFASERSEDLTALGLVLLVTFVVLLFTKWLA